MAVRGGKFVCCKGTRNSCGYEWNFPSRTTCYRCNAPLQTAAPRRAKERQPLGVWSQGRSKDTGEASKDEKADSGRSQTEVEKCLRLLESAKALECEEAIQFAERKLAAAREARDASKSTTVKTKNAIEAVQKAERQVETAKAERQKALGAVEAAKQDLAEADKALLEAEQSLADRQASSAKIVQDEANHLSSQGSPSRLPPELLPNSADDGPLAAQRSAAAEQLRLLHSMLHVGLPQQQGVAPTVDGSVADAMHVDDLEGALHVPQQQIATPAVVSTSTTNGPNDAVGGSGVDAMHADDLDGLDLSKFDLAAEDEGKRKSNLLALINEAQATKRRKELSSRG